MGILQLPTPLPAQVGLNPATKKMVTTDSLATITTAGYLNAVNLESYPISKNDILEVLYSYDTVSQSGTFGIFTVAISNGVITLSAFSNSGEVSFSGPASTANAIPVFSNTSGDIKAASTPSTFGQPLSVSSSTSSATPGTIRALKGAMTGSSTTMTSGNLVGVRGEVDMVGASGGFIYGVQGKVIPTGTLSGSVWAPAVFGQYDLSAATINAGQIAAIWGDMGASGGTFTDVTGARMFAGTNTIASLTLNSMIYLYGKATNLFELSGSSSTYISAAAGSTAGGDLKKLAITIDGVTHYILAAATYS